MLKFNHKRLRRDAAGEVTGILAAPAIRETVGVLGRNYGPDEGRSLVVGLEAGDVVTFRPKGTRQKVSMEAVALYHYILRTLAATARREKAAKGRKAS